MSRIIASEWRKLRATPTMWWLLVGVVGVGIAATLGAIILDNARDVPPLSDQALRDAMHSAGSGSILVIVAGIIAMAGEFRFGQADQTFMSHPNRRRVLTAKTLLMTGLGFVFGLVAVLTSMATTAIWLSTKGESLPVGREAIWLTIIGALASAMLYGALGVAIGAASRNQIPAIVATLAWIIVLEPIGMQISTEVAKWLPGNASLALRRVPEAGLLAMGIGAATFAAWTVAAWVTGLRRTLRADIS